jgi:hypothetical protein
MTKSGCWVLQLAGWPQSLAGAARRLQLGLLRLSVFRVAVVVAAEATLLPRKSMSRRAPKMAINML